MEILYQDESIIVCIKPSGVNSQDDGGKECMPGLIRAIAGGDVFPVHRLDKDVSGVMVYARSKGAAAALSGQIASGIFEKEYTAVCRGALEEKSGRMEDFLFHDKNRNKTYAVKKERKGVKKATLKYEVIAEKTVDLETFSLVKIELLTGRTHQIRVQFSARRHPLAYDRKYGGGKGGETALFCRKISFYHPDSNTIAEFSAEIPRREPFNLFSLI